MSHRVTGTAWNEHVGPWVPCGQDEEIIRELLGIRGLYNPNLHIDSTIISLVFKSDYMLQLKEASAGSFMGTATVSRRQKGLESFGEEALFVESRNWQTAPVVVVVAAVEGLTHVLMLNMGGDA